MKRFLDHSRTSILLVATILLIATPALALQGQSTYDLAISSTPEKLANPGELVTHVFTLNNQGASADTYELTLSLPENWSSLPIPDQVTVQAGESKPVFVNVDVPQDAKAEKYEVKLTAKSSSQPSLEVSHTARIQVKSVPGFELSWVVEPAGVGPGGGTNGRFKITNSGNLPDRYDLEAEVPENWTATLEETRVQLMPGQSRTLSATFTAPESGNSGERYRLEVTASSTHDRELEKTISYTGQLAPPPPEKVPSGLYPSWDVFTNVSSNQSGDPSLYFSGRGDIPNLGEVSANLNLSLDGVDSGRLRVMRDIWGFVIDSSSISGSYLSTGGSPMFMMETEDFYGEILFTEESKGLALEKEGDNLDLRAVLGSETGDDTFEFQELQGAYEFSNGVLLDGFITTGSTQTESGTIVGAGLELSGEKFEIYPSFVDISPGYPNQSPRTETGVNVNFEEEEFSSNFNWDYTWTRLGESPDYYHSEEHDFDISTSIDLGENLDSDFSLGFTRRKTDDEPVSNDLYANSVSGSLSGGDTLDWSLGANFSRTEDMVSDTVVHTRGVNASVGFPLGETDHSVSLSISETEGPSETTTNNTYTLRSEFPEVPLSPTFSLTRSSEDATLYTNFSEEAADGASVNISFSASLVQQDSISLSISTSFPDPFRFCGPTKGQIRGYVFLDENGNGEKDPGEEGIKQVLLSLNGEKAMSASNGKFAFPSLSPGNYQLRLEELRSGLKPGIELPKTVEVVTGKRSEVAVPLQPRSWIRGTVYRDENQSGSRDSGEAGLGGVAITLTGEGTSREVSSGSNGRFVVDLSPGTYTLQLQEGSLPERFETTTPATVQVKTEKYGRTEVEFGVYRKPRPVKVTFGPPTARFTYSPEEVEVGEKVTLDGSDSTAIETEISTYEWTITRGETEITKTGRQASVSFPEAGSWEVTLTVTDENGLKGQQVKKIQVSG